MGKRIKKKTRLKSHTAKKAWEMIRAGACYKDISESISVTVTAIKIFAAKKYKEVSNTLWSKEIRAVGRCEICGKTDNLNAHHILEKSVWSHLARDLSNGICLCSDHHTFNVDISPHRCISSSQAFLEWLQINRPGQYKWYMEHKQDEKYQGCDYEAAYNELF